MGCIALGISLFIFGICFLIAAPVIAAQNKRRSAETTGIGRNTMRKLVDWGKIPVLKVGRKTIIRRDTLENFMTVNQGRNLRNETEVREVH